MYLKYAEMLLESGHAYHAFDTPEELKEMRERLKAAGMAAPQYNAVTRSGMKNSLTLSAEEVEKRLAAGDKYIVRVKMPRNEEVKFQDIIRGWVSVNTNNLDDKVLFKSDGMPTYHLANVVDDYLMNISHVIRGEEWLPSAPLHVLLYRFFGWADVMPQFAHLPLILRPDGNGKLSKRDGDRLGFPVFPTNWKNPETGEQSSGYRERGYYPGAFNNMLAFLGWNPGTTQELFNMEELIQTFSLERVGKAGAKFDFDKTNWFNQQYLRMHNGADLAAQLKPYLEAENLEAEQEYIAQVCDLMKERATFVQDILKEGRYFFEAPTSYDEKTIKKKWKEQTPAIITELSALLKELPSFDAESIGACFKSFLEAKELGFGAVMPGFRVSVTGLGAGASMNDIAALLGKEEVLRRIEVALNTIKK
jgi:glutamyl-tRNA synthetase